MVPKVMGDPETENVGSGIFDFFSRAPKIVDFQILRAPQILRISARGIWTFSLVVLITLAYKHEHNMGAKDFLKTTFNLYTENNFICNK